MPKPVKLTRLLLDFVEFFIRISSIRFTSPSVFISLVVLAMAEKAFHHVHLLKSLLVTFLELLHKLTHYWNDCLVRAL